MEKNDETDRIKAERSHSRDDVDQDVMNGFYGYDGQRSISQLSETGTLLYDENVKYTLEKLVHG